MTRRLAAVNGWLPWRLRKRLAAVNKSFDALWLDHLNRCGCHDSWNQCEHSASGKHSDECGCCQWC